MGKSKVKETFLYLVFGVLSTIINILIYAFFTRALGFNFLISNAFAWIGAVIFAYITNKLFVFESKDLSFSFVIKEFATFVNCRILSGAIEMALMYLMITILGIDDFIVKVITNFIVIVLNYIFSKVLIFKNANTKENS